jgi:hypothetical protein
VSGKYGTDDQEAREASKVKAMVFHGTPTRKGIPVCNVPRTERVRRQEW